MLEQGYWLDDSLPTGLISSHRRSKLARCNPQRFRYGILRSEEVAGGGRRRRAGDDELMCRKTRSLVGLEHAVAERVLLGKVGNRAARETD